MRNHFRSVLTIITLSIGLFSLAYAQDKAQPATRTPSAKADLSGIWETGRLSVRPEGPDGKPIGQGITFTTKIRQMEAPYQPWAAAKAKASVDGGEIDDPMTRCWMAGVPRTMTNPFPFQIVQTPGLVVILYEWDHTYRIIPTDGRPHAKDLDPSFMGDSVGHWEGDTLVVDVTGFNDKTWLDHAGHFHTEALHIVERYRRADPDTIDYEATIEDPNVMTKPWILKFTLKRSNEPQLMENECTENERDLTHLVGK